MVRPRIRHLQVEKIVFEFSVAPDKGLSLHYLKKQKINAPSIIFAKIEIFQF